MSWVFETTDRRGFKIRLGDRIWRYKVTIEHPETLGNERLVRKAVEDPLYGVIYQDKDFADRNVYYRRWGRAPYYMKVVVRFKGEEGEVISAYPQTGCTPGEKML